MVLATWSKSYIDALDASRYRGPATGRDASAGTNRWIAGFAGACLRAVADAEVFEHRARDMQRSWRQRVPKVRKNSATDLLLSALPGAPVITVKGAAALIDRSFPAANNAIMQLVGAGVLSQVTIGRRNRAYEAPEIIAAFTDLERQLASPEGDSDTSEPVRRVPRRREAPRSC